MRPPAEACGDSLPLVALTCIDPRLNALLPNALGLSPEHFIWLRNAGNIITSVDSSTMRSLALACAVKGGREIAIIGHTDCGVRKTGMTELMDRFKKLGIPRERLPHDLVSFFGTFASERQNVIRGVEFARASALIGPRVPVHGLLIDIENGRLECVVDGNEVLDRASSVSLHAPVAPTPPPPTAESMVPPVSADVPKNPPALPKPPSILLPKRSFPGPPAKPPRR